MQDKEWIYYFDDSGHIRINHELLKLFPRLSKADDKWIKYYILAYDYVRSPYKFRPRDEARLMAARLSMGMDHIPGDEDPEAVKELLSVIYDDKHETVIALREKIKKLNSDLVSEDDTKKLTVLLSTIDRLQEMLDSTLEKIKEKSEEVKIGKGKTLSFVEKLKRNRKLYELKKHNV